MTTEMLSVGPTEPHRLLMPLAFGTPDAGIAADSDRYQVEVQLATLIMYHPDQRRRDLRWDDELHVIARLRVAQIQRRAQWTVYAANAHLDANGRGPNWWLREWGITLPDGYSEAESANNVEALRLGPSSAKDALAAFLASPPHRALLLGDDFRGTRLGVGICETWETPPAQWIWSVLIA